MVSSTHRPAAQRHTFKAALLAVCAWGIFALGGPPEALAVDRCVSAGDVTLCSDQEYPRDGDPCTIRVSRSSAPVVGALITATYRPNSQVAETDTVGYTDDHGVLIWTPATAAITTLAALEDGTELANMTISVRFRSVPVLGLVVMLFAAFVLFGGNSYSFAKSFGKR